MDLLRSLGLFFLFLLVPLGALLASYPGPIAEWLSGLFAVEISRGNLGAGFGRDIGFDHEVAFFCVHAPGFARHQGQAPTSQPQGVRQGAGDAAGGAGDQAGLHVQTILGKVGRLGVGGVLRP